jgi:beta-glucanase (GH16 family)
MVWLFVLGACATPAFGWPFPPRMSPPRAVRVVPGPSTLFYDNFDGKQLDLAKWQPNWLGADNRTVTKPVNSRESSCYDPRQVRVSDGYLHLRADRRQCTDVNGKIYQYASGLVNTRRSFTFTYGRVEARVRLDAGSNGVRNWPAVWTNGTGSWPVTGEMDVFEGLAGKHCWHFHSPAGAPGGCVKPRVAGGWHVFAAEWRPGRVTFTYDGKYVGETTKGITGAPMYLVLNYALSNSVSPPIVTTSEMLVDYVKVTRLTV